MFNKNKFPKITVVTPSFNQGEFLEKTIKSVLDQNYPNLEYIIIDGGSTDGSVEIIKKYQNELSFWVSRKDKGHVDALNKGFFRSTGEIMTWINSDDILMPGSLQLVVKIFRSLHSIDWINGISININSDDNIIKIGKRQKIIFNFLVKKGWYHSHLLGFLMQEGMFWRRKLWKKTGGIIKNNDTAFDYKLWKKFAKHSKLVPVQTSLAAFRIQSNSITNSKMGRYEYLENSEFIVPNLLLPFMKYLRESLFFVSRKFRLSPNIYFSSILNEWVYDPSIFGGKKSILKHLDKQ